MSESAEQHVPSYELLVDGQAIPPEQRDRVKEIRVVDYLRLPDVCTVHVTYPQGDGVDSMPFAVGKKVEVRLGETEALAPVSLFKGQIVTLEPEFGGGGCSVAIRAYDRAHVLHRSRATRTFQNQTSSDIVTKIVSDAGLSADCDPSGEPHDFMQQDNETDWDFIWRLAERIGFEFVVEDTVAHFRRPAPEDAVELEWPTTLHTFRPRVTAVQQVQEVTLLAQDPKTKQVIDVSVSTPNQIAQIGVDRATVAGAIDTASLHIATEPVKSSAEGKALAQALLDKLANGYVGAEGIGPGNPKIRAGAKVKVSGVGTTFGGTYRVATSMHVLRGGGAYETHFANSPSHTLLDAVGSGGDVQIGAQLMLGIVTQNDDPDGMGRVRVKYPALGDDVEGAWARIATASAGDARGLLMLPVPGEEVLVGFEHGDTTRPYVLGSLFNGAEKPGDDLLQGKDGSFALRSDHKIYLHCAEDMTLDSGGGLTVTVGKDASIKTQQGFTVEAQQSAGLKAMQDVTIEGTTSLTLKCGAAQIQLSASGVTISGPTINIG